MSVGCEGAWLVDLSAMRSRTPTRYGSSCSAVNERLRLTLQLYVRMCDAAPLALSGLAATTAVSAVRCSCRVLVGVCENRGEKVKRAGTHRLYLFEKNVLLLLYLHSPSLITTRM